MSTKIESLIRVLRDLPYEDMVRVAGALSDKLKGIHSAHHLADALSGLRAEFIDESHVADTEDKALRELIGTRSKGFKLVVSRLPKGWSVWSDTLPGAAAQAPDLRTAIQHSLDQIITAHIMMKK